MGMIDYGAVEFGRRVDGNFNVWELDPEYGWIIRDVRKTHETALKRVRELRAMREANPPRSWAYRPPGRRRFKSKQKAQLQ